MDHLLFCDSHPEKIAKRHCKKCKKDLCNECIFDSHIEHHEEITKIEYKIDIKKTRFTDDITKDIKLIIDKALDELKPKIQEEVLKKTQEYIKQHKNLQLKINQSITNPSTQNRRYSLRTATQKKKEEKKKTLNEHNQQTKESNKKMSSKIKEKTKIFNPQNTKVITKNKDKNNPYNAGTTGNIINKAKIFEQKK